jgi:hypothetical protein
MFGLIYAYTRTFMNGVFCCELADLLILNSRYIIHQHVLTILHVVGMRTEHLSVIFRENRGLQSLCSELPNN